MPKNELKEGIIVNKSNVAWNIEMTNGIGGRFIVPNSSNGYHMLLKDWWDYYCFQQEKWLLVTENNEVKKVFKDTYPNKIFFTVDLYDDFNNNTDYQLDICNEKHCIKLPEVDVVLCQATLEHIYAPFQAVKNMNNTLNNGGYLILHTHTPGYRYHQYPRDYMRFYPDWFEDLEYLIPELNLLELASSNNHIFALYRKEIKI